VSVRYREEGSCGLERPVINLDGEKTGPAEGLEGNSCEGDRGGILIVMPRQREGRTVDGGSVDEDTRGRIGCDEAILREQDRLQKNIKMLCQRVYDVVCVVLTDVPEQD